MHYVTNGNALVKFLKKFNVNRKTAHSFSLYQRTPQDMATGEGHEDIVEYLKEAVSIYMRLYSLPFFGAFA